MEFRLGDFARHGIDPARIRRWGADGILRPLVRRRWEDRRYERDEVIVACILNLLADHGYRAHDLANLGDAIREQLLNNQEGRDQIEVAMDDIRPVFILVLSPARDAWSLVIMSPAFGDADGARRCWEQGRLQAHHERR